MTSENLFDQFAAHIDVARPFLHHLDGTVLTIGGHGDRSRRLASALVAIDTNSSDQVALQVEKPAAAPGLYQAARRMDAVVLPLEAAYCIGESSYFLNDTEPSLVVRGPFVAGGASDLAPDAASVLSLDADGLGKLINPSQSQSSEFETAPLNTMGEVQKHFSGINTVTPIRTVPIRIDGAANRQLSQLRRRAACLTNQKRDPEHWTFESTRGSVGLS